MGAIASPSRKNLSILKLREYKNEIIFLFVCFASFSANFYILYVDEWRPNLGSIV